ncbi:MAG: SulP family inorganic anion transporter [Patescibacteria group bacterium]
MKKRASYFFPFSLEQAKHNWKAALTVSLVAIPLSISLAVAAGATPTQGIVTAIWAGVIAGIFGGSNYNITGPTGALSGLLATFVFTNGANSLWLLTVLVGTLILVAWFFRLERYLIYIPANTIQGFTLGVAFIIGLNQFNFAFGLSGLPKHEAFIDNLIESFRHIGDSSLAALATFAVFFFLMFTVERAWRKIPKVPHLPAAVILTPFGILLGYLSATGKVALGLQTLGMRYTDMAPRLFLPYSFEFHIDRSLFVVAVTIALIAILETMLSAKIADGMTKTKHNKRNEMLGLGLANLASGFAGGIPATAALARTALNIKSGASHKVSAAMSALFVALISFLLLTSFQYIPLAVIAAILVTVAVRMVEREHFRRMWLIDKKSFIIALIVAGITIYEDPIAGILVGAAVSLVLFLDTLSRGQFDLVINDTNKKIVGRLSGHDIGEITQNSHTLVYSIKGHLTYIDSQAHISRFELNLNGYENIILRLRELYFIDLDGVDAFDEIVSIIERREKKVYITGANDLTIHILRQSHAFKRLEKHGQVFPHTADALETLGFKLNIAHEYQ